MRYKISLVDFNFDAGIYSDNNVIGLFIVVFFMVK
jgi:hypothetical protein